jgi:hypothetical protein
MTMEIKLIEGKAELSPYKINYEELKDLILATTSKYENLVITEYQIKEGKKERADLNKITKDLKAFFTKTKKDHLKPLELLDTQIKELAGYVVEASESIDKQIKNFEEKQKEDKKKELISYYESVKVENVSFESIFDEKWLNLSCSIKNAKQDIEDKISVINSEIATIKSFNSKNEALMIDEYYKTKYSLQSAISLNQRMVAIEEAEEKRKAEEEKRKAEENLKNEPVEEVVKTVIVEQSTLGDFIDKEPETFTRSIKITGTKEQLHALKAFLDSNKMSYEAV